MGDNPVLTLAGLIDDLQDLISNGDASPSAIIMSRGSTSKMLEDNLNIRVTRTKSGRSAVYIGPSKDVTVSNLDLGRSDLDGLVPTTESTTTMTDSSKPFASVDYVYGRDITTLSTNELIAALSRVNSEIKGLQSVDATSTKITSMVEDLTSMKAKIVAALDAAK